MGAAVEAGAAGEETVTVRDLHHIFFGAADAHNSAGAAFIPDINIRLGIKSDNATAGGAAGGLNTDTVFFGNGHKTIGISISQIRFGEER